MILFQEHSQRQVNVLFTVILIIYWLFNILQWYWHLHVPGDIIDQLKVLVALLGWDKDLQQLMADQKTNQSQDSEKSPDKQTANDKEVQSCMEYGIF